MNLYLRRRAKVSSRTQTRESTPNTRGVRSAYLFWSIVHARPIALSMQKKSRFTGFDWTTLHLGYTGGQGGPGSMLPDNRRSPGQRENGAQANARNARRPMRSSDSSGMLLRLQPRSLNTGDSARPRATHWFRQPVIHYYTPGSDEKPALDGSPLDFAPGRARDDRTNVRDGFERRYPADRELRSIGGARAKDAPERERETITEYFRKLSRYESRIIVDQIYGALEERLRKEKRRMGY